MESLAKVGPRKRQVVGWRALARRVAENRSRQRTPPVPLVKR